MAWKFFSAQGQEKAILGAAIKNSDVAANAAISRDKLDRDLTIVSITADQSIASGTFTFVAFNTELVDDKNRHDNVTNNTRITFDTAGAYLIGWQLAWQNVPGGNRKAQIRLTGGSDYIASIVPRDTSFGTTWMVGAMPMVVAANDYIEMLVWQDSGSAVNVLSASNYTRMWAYKI